MGRIFDLFNNLRYENEADVSLKFTIPLLTSFLGFSITDIVPEHEFPARDIFYGIRKLSTKDLPESQRPDFVVCLGQLDKPRFVVDSKGPKEKLEKHLSQLRSYALGAKVNFLVITNGSALKIYYGQEEVLNLPNIMYLDIFFNHVRLLLHKDVHLRNSPLQIIQKLNLEEIEKTKQNISENRKAKIRLEISDYHQYLATVSEELKDWHISYDFIRDFKEIHKVSPSKLHIFRRLGLETKNSNEKDLNQHNVLYDFDSHVKIIYGKPGIGKTTLLRYIDYTQAKRCIDLIDHKIPVLIRLRSFGLNRSIRSLIIDSLNKGGYVFTEENFKKDLLGKKLIFLLDGFDEIPEKYQNDALCEITDFINDYPQQRFVISSRSSRQLQIPLALSFKILPLSRERIEVLVEENLGPRKAEFIHQLYQLGLINEIRTTLLLILTIRLYQLGKKIPQTRTKIIEEIVSGIEDWEKTKVTRRETRISWKVKKDLLENIAYIIKEKGLGSTLPQDELNSFLVRAIAEYEKARDIPVGLGKTEMLKELSTTGLVYHDDFGLTFHVMAFLDHFASLKLAKLYAQHPGVLQGKLDKLIWHNVVVAAASKLADPDMFVREIFQADPLKAAACLVENEKIENNLRAEIISALEKKCSSRFPTVRNRSLYYLRRTKKSYTKEVFQRLLESDHVFVKMTAIEALSEEGGSEANEIVNKYFDWDEGGMIIGDTTQGAIARALANLDDEQSHLRILDIWRRKVDMFTVEDCKNAMLSLVYRNKLTPTIRDKLVDLFLAKEPEKDISWFSKLRGIADVLVALEDETIAPKLIQSLSDVDDSGYRSSEISRILASFKSIDIMNTLIEGCLNQGNPRSVRVRLVEALAKAKYFTVELNILKKLLSDKDPLIRRKAILGFSRFPEYKIKDLLLQLVNDNDVYVHTEAVRLLGEFGLLPIISDEKKFPKQFNPEELFAQVRRYKLVEFLPILDKLRKKWLGNNKEPNERTLIDLANTYLALGKTSVAYSIIRSFCVKDELHFQDEYAYAHLADLCPSFGEDLGLKILNDIYDAVKRERKEFSSFSSSLMDTKYIENLERIGSPEAIEILAQLCEEYAGKEGRGTILFERAMRAIVLLSPKSKEDWLIELINSHPELSGPDLHRAIEALGVIGTEKSIPIIKRKATEHIKSEYILNGCFLAIENINLSEGRFISLDDDQILSLKNN